MIRKPHCLHFARFASFRGRSRPLRQANCPDDMGDDHNHVRTIVIHCMSNPSSSSSSVMVPNSKLNIVVPAHACVAICRQ